MARRDQEQKMRPWLLLSSPPAQLTLILMVAQDGGPVSCSLRAGSFLFFLVSCSWDCCQVLTGCTDLFLEQT